MIVYHHTIFGNAVLDGCAKDVPLRRSALPKDVLAGYAEGTAWTVIDCSDLKMIDLPRSCASNGIVFHRTGAGAPVLLTHGVGLRAECWRAQIDDLQRDYEIFAVDLPGPGASDQLNCAQPGLTDYTQAVASLIVAVIDKPIAIVGHSMGAMVALDLASRYGELCVSVAALNAIHHRSLAARKAVRQRAALLRESRDSGRGVQDSATGPVTRWFGLEPAGEAATAAKHCHCWLNQTDRQGYSTAYSVFANEDGPSDLALHQLSVPALFLTGENDEISTPAMSAKMAGKVTGATAVTVKNAGHMAQMTHWREVNTALRVLLAKTPLQGGAWIFPKSGD